MFDPFTILAIVGTFLIAGTIKGVIGLGLPLVSLALLTVAIDLPHAMALLLVPSFITNLWQAGVGGNGRAILRRLWPFLLMVTVTVWLGTATLTRVDLSLLSALLGVLLVVYSTVSLADLRLTISTRQEVWIGPLVGLVSGILTGMTGTFVVPGVWFLLAIGLSRDMLIQAMGMLFSVSTFSLAVAMQGNDLLTIELGTLSVVALLPAIIGMVLGLRIRQWLSEQLFRRIFFISLLMLGTYIIANAFDGFK
jgi:uncharacterized membrane protein YfcA